MDDLDVIRRTIEEHHKVRGNIRLVGEAVNDMEAILGLQQSHASWGQSSAVALPDVLERLQRSISGLNEGLRNHFGFEEKYLPPVFGTNLMKALIFDHDEIRQKLAVCAGSMVVDLKSQSQEELLASRNRIQQMVADLTGTIESHASREEVVLRMLERALHRDNEENAKAQPGV
jgi:hypothetical protein